MTMWQPPLLVLPPHTTTTLALFIAHHRRPPRTSLAGSAFLFSLLSVTILRPSYLSNRLHRRGFENKA
ncbi:hypothetical protein F8388_018639 [Cannabis sativa]|uniref:Uncharacterized protein n=1 Tax=Cannabis sativa TaxID=3483 RepID=A0A7J6HPH2_CANSA|nr:hypothetical protein F8388_018639 [Cannabis sativa]KAF4397177.1 hypothetical protein G4B88_009023 [Cannabis sativa]